MTLQHLTTLELWSIDDINHLLDLSLKLKGRHKDGVIEDCLLRKTVGLYFEKPSTRTRISFEVAAHHLGAKGLYIDMRGKRLGEREAIKDIAQVTSRMVDGLMARVYDHQTVVELSQHATVPIINGLSDYNHPCQALADFQTIEESLGRRKDFTIAYVGDGNNVARSLAVVALKLGAKLVLSSPEGYELPMDFIDNLSGQETPGEVVSQPDPGKAVAEADIVYTDAWASMGQEDETEQRRKIFADFQINSTLMAAAPTDAKFMHCLPAHRGEEVTDEVIDSPASIVYDQAENRLHTAKALLVYLMTDKRDV